MNTKLKRSSKLHMDNYGTWVVV